MRMQKPRITAWKRVANRQAHSLNIAAANQCHWLSLACRGLLSARSIAGDGCADECLERLRVNLFSLVNVDGPPYVPVETRVEEPGRIFQGSALMEGQLYDRLVRLSRADAPVVLPYRSAHPLPLFDNVRVGFSDEGAHPCERIASPVT